MPYFYSTFFFLHYIFCHHFLSHFCHSPLRWLYMFNGVFTHSLIHPCFVNQLLLLLLWLLLQQSLPNCTIQYMVDKKILYYANGQSRLLVNQTLDKYSTTMTTIYLVVYLPFPHIQPNVCTAHFTKYVLVVVCRITLKGIFGSKRRSKKRYNYDAAVCFDHLILVYDHQIIYLTFIHYYLII